jgi:hypothetical protein
MWKYSFKLALKLNVCERSASFTSSSYWQVANTYHRQVTMHVTVCQTINEITADWQGNNEVEKPNSLTAILLKIQMFWD